MTITRRSAGESIRVGIYYGDVFEVHKFVENITVGSFTEICIVTKERLLEFTAMSMSTTAEILTTELFEYADVTINSPIVPINRNRNDKIPMIEEFSDDFSINDIGSKFHESKHYGVAGQGNSVALSEGGSLVPWGLEADTTYIARLTNDGSSTMAADIRLLFSR